ncbi:MAG: hypothetical protein WCR45_02735 [Bacteroidaceae bacterium]|nr:hypothetical protein [Bacilli bacterium]
MEKLKNFAKKNTGVIGIVIYGLVFVYSLCMATPTSCLQYYSEYENFYETINPINNAIIFIGMGGVLINIFYATTKSNTRKYYYISNYIWLLIAIGFSIFAAIFLISKISFYQEQYFALPFDKINDYFISHHIEDKTWLSKNPVIFNLGYACAILILIYTLLPIFTGVVQLKKSQRLKEINREYKAKTKGAN